MKEISINFNVRMFEQDKDNVIRVLEEMGYTTKWQDLPKQALTIISEQDIPANDAFEMGMIVSSLAYPKQ